MTTMLELFAGCGGVSAGRAITVRAASEPVMTLPSNAKASYRAWLDMGRVVALTPQAGAALQSFPAEFILPERNSLAWTCVGNACPPEWMPHIGVALGALTVLGVAGRAAGC